MSAKWILVIWMGSGGVATSDFNTQASCEFVLKRWKEEAKRTLYGRPGTGFCIRKDGG